MYTIRCPARPSARSSVCSFVPLVRPSVLSCPCARPSVRWFDHPPIWGYAGIMFVQEFETSNKHSARCAIGYYFALTFQQEADICKRAYIDTMGEPPAWPTEEHIADVPDDTDAFTVDDADEESNANTDASQTDDEGGLAHDPAVVIDADANDDAANVASRLLGSLVESATTRKPSRASATVSSSNIASQRRSALVAGVSVTRRGSCVP